MPALTTYCCPDCDYPYEPGKDTLPPCASCGSENAPVEAATPRVEITPVTQAEVDAMTKIVRTYNEATLDWDEEEVPLTQAERDALLSRAQATIDGIDPILIAQETP